MTNPFVNAVDIFSNADKTKLPENWGPEEAIPGVCPYKSLEHPIPKSPDPDSLYRIQLLAKFFEVYLPKAGQGSTRASQSPASWVYILHDITQTDSTYNTSLGALCVAQLGIWNRDPVLVKESSQLYGSALGELRKTVSYRKLAAPEATLASIVILTMYEVSLIPGATRTESNVNYCRCSRLH